MKSVVVTDFVGPGISETFGVQGPWAHALLKVVKRCAKPRFVRDGARIWSGSVNGLLNDSNPTAGVDGKLN